MQQKISTLIAFLLCLSILKSNAQWNLTGNANATATSILGTTNAIPLNITTNNVQRLVIDANGKVGIGIAAPPNVFSVKGSGGVPSSVWTNAGAPLFTGFGEQTVGNADYILSMASSLANARPVFIGRRSKGTLAAPTVVANNDQIMSFLSSGYDGSAFQNPAAIDFFVDGTPSAGNVPARISFVTGTNGANRAERLKIGNTGDITINTNQLFVQKTTGNIGVGTISPQAKMDITGQVKISGGTPGTGKVLTSDSAGLASWQNLPSNAENDPQVSSSIANKVPKWNGTTLTDGSITDNGNVGIGEANPSGILHVSQPSAFTGVSFTGSGFNDLTVNNGGYTGTGTTSYVIRISNPGPTPNIIEVSNDGGATFAAPVAIVNPVVLANGVTAIFAASGGHTFGDQWAWSVGQAFSNVLVAKDGKVGIGTASPVATLDINGTLKISGGGPGTGKVLVSDATGIGSWNTLSTLETDPQVSVADTSAVPRWNGAALVTGTITDNGTNVGIGTTTPAALLDVNGDAQINGLRIGKGNSGLSSNMVVGSDSALAYNTTGTNNIAIGKGTMKANTTSSSNVAIGNATLQNNKTYSGSVAIGDSALYKNGSAGPVGLSGNRINTAIGNKSLLNNSTGVGNTATGNSSLYANEQGYWNSAFGEQALYANTSGNENTAMGFRAMKSNTTATGNTAIGSHSLYSNKTSSANTAVGAGALISLYSGGGSTAIGYQALFWDTAGKRNTAVGNEALYQNKSGDDNVAVGSWALLNNTTGISNTATGSSALYTNTLGSGNTATGYRALRYNTYGNANTANGYESLMNNTNGNDNTANGYESLMKNTTGSSNTATGDGALYNNTTGNSNTAFGTTALYNNISGYSNVAMGMSTLLRNVNGHNIVAIGDSSLYNHTGGGNYNTAVGSKSLYSSFNSGGNTAIGYYTLHDITTGDYNSAIGYRANSVTTTESNTTGVGYDADPTATNTIAVGNTSITSIKGQVGFGTYSDRRFKKNIKEGEVKGLEFINLLRPVTYNSDINAYAKWKEANYGEKDTTTWEGKYDVEKIRFSGFLAQEVEATAKKIGYEFSGVDAPKNSKDIYALRYAEFVVPLVKAVQELSIKNEVQQKVNEELKAKAAELDTVKKEMADLKAMMQQLLNSNTNVPCPPLAGQ